MVLHEMSSQKVELTLRMSSHALKIKKLFENKTHFYNTTHREATPLVA